MKFQFIQEQEKVFPILEICRLLGVSRSGYYAWRARPLKPLSERTQQNQHLSEQIKRVFEENHGCYGSPRIHQELKAQGLICDVKRVARLMRALQLKASEPRRFVVTTDSTHPLPVAPNHLNREYQVEKVAGLNQVWAGDITYIPTAGCPLGRSWLYMAVVLDLKSRRVIGWSMATSLDQQLVHDAFEMAVGQRLPSLASKSLPPTLLFHSDRGSQYAACAYQKRLVETGIVCSMSRRGNCLDNAPGALWAGKAFLPH